MDEWNLDTSTYPRMRNTMAWGTLALGNDDQEMQFHQAEVYQDELRSGINRIQEFGLSTMPLPGAKAHLSFHGGQRTMGTIMATEDPRYRPKGLKPGETHAYMVDEADAKGENGKTRSLMKGALGWINSIFGKTINLGTDTTTQTINIGHSGTLTINVSGGTINLNVDHGDIVVNGISLVHHKHPDPQGGLTGEPV